jgi:hypothetical protein
LARLSLGLEGGAPGNEEYDAGRGGGFVRATLRNLEATLSGGFTGNYLEDDPRPLSAVLRLAEASGSALPAPLPAVLGIVTCQLWQWSRKSTHQSGVALSGRASCVRGMSSEHALEDSLQQRT